MAAVRRNILESSDSRDKFLQGLVALDQLMLNITAGDVFAFLQRNSIPIIMEGLNQRISVYDIFVLWHVVAMSIPMPMPPRNAAHSGPIFLPWHRMYLLRLEQELQRVTGDPDFGLPYWDWAVDGEMATIDQWRSQLWSAAYLGESRGDVLSGQLGQMRVRLYQFRGILLSLEPRPIQREAGLDSLSRNLPTQSDVQRALEETEYDRFPWSRTSNGHRNRLEGWLQGSQLHNRVHVWIGGDMGPGTSPNDPAFFLNHCNVDRIWEAWMARSGREYRPNADGPLGHRINDLMVSILGNSLRPSEVLDPAEWYSYDTLTVV